MKRREREAVIDKLLLITGISIGISLVLLFIYKGYMNTAYVLGTRNLIIAISIINVVITLFFILFYVLRIFISEIKIQMSIMKDKNSRFSISGLNFSRIKIQKSIIKDKRFKRILVLVAVSIASVFIHYYNIYAIFILCIMIALYLVYSFIAGVYKIITK